MINTLTLFLCVLLSPSLILPSGRSAGSDQYHRKFDEYNDLPPKAEKKRLDDLALALKSEPDSVGYILAYGGRRSCFGEAKARADRAKHYLLRGHNIAAGRVVAMDGGYQEELTIDLWIGVRGGPPLPTLPTVDEKDMQLVGDCRPRGTLRPAPNKGMNRTRNKRASHPSR